MWLILGLGNVGSEYEKSRHNFGFLAVERFSQIHRGDRWKSKWNYFYSEIPERKIVCAQPKTMMNLSGIAAMQALKKLGLAPDRMIVIYDDIDIPFGNIRVRAKGSYGGHKGILSICSVLDTEDFPRIRLGIGGNEDKTDTVSFVLGNFTDEEQKSLDEILNKACDAALMITEGRLQQAMNKYN